MRKNRIHQNRYPISLCLTPCAETKQQTFPLSCPSRSCPPRYCRLTVSTLLLLQHLPRGESLYSPSIVVSLLAYLLARPPVHRNTFTVSPSLVERPTTLRAGMTRESPRLGSLTIHSEMPSTTTFFSGPIKAPNRNNPSAPGCGKTACPWEVQNVPTRRKVRSGTIGLVTRRAPRRPPRTDAGSSLPSTL